jgi:hypothetical protein
VDHKGQRECGSADGVCADEQWLDCLGYAMLADEWRTSA